MNRQCAQMKDSVLCVVEAALVTVRHVTFPVQSAHQASGISLSSCHRSNERFGNFASLMWFFGAVIKCLQWQKDESLKLLVYMYLFVESARWYQAENMLHIQIQAWRRRHGQDEQFHTESTQPQFWCHRKCRWKVRETWCLETNVSSVIMIISEQGGNDLSRAYRREVLWVRSHPTPSFWKVPLFWTEKVYF